MGFSKLQENVIGSGLCTSCGTCVGICPTTILSIDNKVKPFIKGECSNCDLCVDTCPAIKFDFAEFEKSVTERNSKKDELIGSYTSIYVGKTRDKHIRTKATGGGIVSSILISALEKEIIDGAIVTKMDEDDPTVPRVFIARNKNDILEAAQSKYLSVPLNSILNVFKKKTGTYAVVGLPCHIHGIRNAQKKRTIAASRIKFTVGLFCGITMRNDIVDYLLHVLNIRNDDVKKIYFRSNEYKGASSTGGFLVVTQDGKKHYLDKVKYQVLKYIFANPGCLYCIDHTNEFADISVGDLWLKSFVQKGEKLPSCIIVRTKRGKKLLENCREIELFELDLQDVIKCQSSLLAEKLIRAHKRLSLRKEKKMYTPIYNRAPIKQEYILPKYNIKFIPPSSVKNRLISDLWVPFLNLMQKDFVLRVLPFVPPRMVRVFVSQFIRLHESDGVIQPYP